MSNSRRTTGHRGPTLLLFLMTMTAIGLILAGGIMVAASNARSATAETSANVSPNHGSPRASPASHTAPSPRSTPSPRVRIPAVNLRTPGFASWALLDRRTGRIRGSSNLDAPSDTMSLVKAWLAADYLRRVTGRPDQNSLNRITTMIRDSGNPAADEFYRRNGRRASIERMVRICRLTESRPYDKVNNWSNTVVSARDVARLGACIADGRAAGRAWTDWLVTQMRLVRGTGNFGPRAVFRPEVAAEIAIKNGWLLRAEDGLWHISCLAVSADWSIGVLLRYPARLGFAHGREQCRAVAAQLLPALRTG